MIHHSFQSMLQKFFLERLMNQMNASPDTIKAYRDTFRIFLRYMNEEKHCAPSQLTLEMINAENVLDFLQYIETVRNNSTKTRNHRLAAIHSFMNYVSFQAPEYLSVIQRVMSIPFKKTETRQVEYLVDEEVDAIMQGCDLSSWLGRRDRLMLAILYNTGVRVSELVSIKKRDISLNKNGTGSIRVKGKGRKERSLPLWKTTKQYLEAFLKETEIHEDNYVFTSQQGKQLTRSGVTYRLACLVKTASKSCPSLRQKRVTPHVLRHTTAMHLLEAGVDISTIAIWLGHESIETTHKYMVADLRLKEQALAQTKEPQALRFRYQPPADILSFLDSL
ncbi:Site-specific recombinase XerD [Desulforamulus putei DSM 12395]|uniref:Site-specific recombinase XerD n=1 Tax=Desulforamulus putei DSM 12395 TaxID=1121429 RepID=A0A1M5D8L8_9FIRM|nr:tyrosine-type recombinase/integrase [Desulforamulus putei]SHF63358.1 Site-specific recombinase XerD [Desulforamulus putei DSM 12395]